MFNRNQDIKKAKGNLPNWAIAEKLGIHENTLYRWLRSEMSDEKKQLVIDAINELKRELEEQKQIQNA
jgi:transposase-like protein